MYYKENVTGALCVEEIDIIINGEFRAGQGAPRTQVKYLNEMLVDDGSKNGYKKKYN